MATGSTSTSIVSLKSADLSVYVEFLQEEYLDGHNARFVREPTSLAGLPAANLWSALVNLPCGELK